MSRFILLFYTFFSLLLITPHQLSAQDLQTPQKSFYSETTRYTFQNDNNETAQIPYAANRDISIKSPQVERLIISIHSSSYDPDFYVDTIMGIASEHADMRGKLLIISPAFYRKDKTKLQDVVLWQTDPFWGNNRALYQGKEATWSAFEVLDYFIGDILSSGNFPNIKQIVILGHSAGGQFVNRYAASNTFMDRYTIPVKFLVMAPSSYLYFSPKRANDASRTHFETPYPKKPAYNHWGYGVKKLYGFHKKYDVTAEKMQKRYPLLKIRYLVGSEDVHLSNTLDMNAEAMLQGLNRKQRAITYYNHLQEHFGSNIIQNQDLFIIDGVGHLAKDLIESERGREFILFD